MWTGASRFIHADWLRYDTVLQEIFGFKRMPSQSTYSRFFGKFSWEKNMAFFTKLNQWFFSQIDIGTVSVDLDSTVITRYGEQEGARKGYTPKKPGRNSHHPLMAFMSQTRMVINAWMRPGNTASMSSCINFLIETLDVLKDNAIGLIRADSGFYSREIMGFLENKRLNYIIAVKFYEIVKWEVGTVKQWTEVSKGIDVAEFDYKGRRHIVVRKNVEERPKASGKLLFEDVMPRYRYSCYVTNLNLSAIEIWTLYKSRADCENRIKELKYDFGVEQFCLKSFWATEAAFRFIMVAYNLMSLFKHVAVQNKTLSSLRTVKAYCFALGAWISNHANRKVLKIALPVEKRSWMDGLFSQINDSSPPFSFSNA
ncbi:MAG: IS1380 family transposase [Crocinitomicaceae bacterium]|nr:IS1380 family transposase [Crocinitomicaceae bacterium]